MSAPAKAPTYRCHECGSFLPAYYEGHCEDCKLKTKASCQHVRWTTAFGTRKMCIDCGYERATNPVVPTSYQRRVLQLSPKGVRFPKTPDHQGGGWKTEWFGTLIQPKTLDEAKKIIARWNQDCITSGMLVEYRLDLDLKCSKCDKRVHETYAGNTCLACHMEDKKTMKKNKNDWMADISMDGTIGPSKSVTTFMPVKKPTLVKREEGDIWEIPASSSPLWTKQWGYQGSAKEPYIISKKNKIDGSTTNDAWACSCRAFTQHTPRKDCKHLVNLKHTYGFGTIAPAKYAIANLDSADAEAFAEFKRQKAANAEQKPTSGDADLALFGQTGRKFR